MGETDMSFINVCERIYDKVKDDTDLAQEVAYLSYCDNILTTMFRGFPTEVLLGVFGRE